MKVDERCDAKSINVLVRDKLNIDVHRIILCYFFFHRLFQIFVVMPKQFF